MTLQSYPSNSMILLYISKKEIVKTKTRRTANIAKRAPPFSLEIVVDGYNNDPRDLWEIPEVKTFFMKLLSEYPEVVIKTTPFSFRIVQKCCAKILDLYRENGTTYTSYILSPEWLAAINKGSEALLEYVSGAK